MLERVKLALRISTNLLDTEINESIAAAKAELIRSGVSEDVVEDGGDLVAMAIKTYCQAMLTGDLNARDRYMESFMYQQDCLRKSTL